MHIPDFILSSYELWQMTGWQSFDAILFPTSKQHGKLPGRPTNQPNKHHQISSANVKGKGCPTLIIVSPAEKEKNKPTISLKHLKQNYCAQMSHIWET